MFSLFSRLLSLCLVWCIVLGSSVFGTQDADLQKVEQNIVSGLLSGEIAPFESCNPESADSFLSHLQWDGDKAFFDDVDYENQNRSSWLTRQHLNRTEAIAMQMHRTTDTHIKAGYARCALALLRFWFENDFQNSNWWFNRISVPNVLGETGLLLHDLLPQKEYLKLCEIVGRGTFIVHPDNRSYTGANALDLAAVTIKFGALTHSRQAFRAAANVMRRELRYSAGEGFKKDGTFFQHGNRLYMGGYGLVTITAVTTILQMLEGSRFQLSADALEPLSHYIADGMRAVCFGDTLDPTTMGRSVSRLYNEPMPSMISTLRKLASMESVPRRAEIENLAQIIETDTKENLGLTVFDDAKFIVIHNDDFYFSFRGGDNNLLYSETINDENLLAYNSSFPGVTTIMHTGIERRFASPFLDYAHIPGTTAVPETDAQILGHGDKTYRALPGLYGTVQNGQAAVSFAQTVHEDVRMTIACFATDHAAFLLGADMTNLKGNAMETTVDQGFYTGSFVQKGNTVIYNGIRYTALSGEDFQMQTGMREGNWRRNNASLSDDTVKASMFTLSFPCDGTYAYSVMAEGTNETVQILQNTSKIQAVRLPDGRVAAVFYVNGSFQSNGKTYTGLAGQAKIFD